MKSSQKKAIGARSGAHAAAFVFAMAILTSVPTVGSARDQASLGSLTIPASRVPDGFAASWFDQVDTSGWRVVNVEPSNCADGAGDNDGARIQAAIDGATGPTVVMLSGTGSPCVYNASSRIQINKSRAGSRARRTATTSRITATAAVLSVLSNSPQSAHWLTGATRRTRPSSRREHRGHQNFSRGVDHRSETFSTPQWSPAYRTNELDWPPPDQLRDRQSAGARLGHASRTWPENLRLTDEWT
jgi:hypothetical protein